MLRPGAETLASGPDSGARPDPFSSIDPEPFVQSPEQNLHELWRLHRVARKTCDQLIGQGIYTAKCSPGFGFEFREPEIAQDIIIQLYREIKDGEFEEICPIRVCHEGDVCAWIGRASRVPLTSEEHAIVAHSLDELYRTEVEEVASSTQEV